MGNLSIIYRKISELKPYPRNARTHKRKQVNQIAAAIQEFGFTNPVLIDESDQIIAGHGRVQAAKQLVVPVGNLIRLTSEAESRNVSIL
jgi:ParB-like chromosome segregation protein Spo0J